MTCAERPGEHGQLDVRIYGELNPEAEAWISQFGDIVSRKFQRHVAGFVR
jgi:hypothetical protein